MPWRVESDPESTSGIATSSTAGSFLLATGGTGRMTLAGYRGSRSSPGKAKDGNRGREELNCESRMRQCPIGGEQQGGRELSPQKLDVERLLEEERLGPDRLRYGLRSPNPGACCSYLEKPTGPQGGGGRGERCERGTSRHIEKRLGNGLSGA